MSNELLFYKLKNSRKWHEQTLFLCWSYVLFIFKNKHQHTLETYLIKDIIKLEKEVDIQNYLKEILHESLDKTISNTISIDVSELYNNIIDFPKNSFLFSKEKTNKSILALALKLLDIKEHDVVADFCSGLGSFLIASSKHNPNASYYGYELTRSNYVIAKMKANILRLYHNENLKLDFYSSDVLLNQIPIKFDKIFMETPFNLRPDISYLTKLRSVFPLYESLTLSSSLDWAFMYRLVDRLKHDGVGLALAHPSSTMSVMSHPFRKYFIDNKHVKAVISLPPNMLSYSSVSPVLYLLGHNQDKVTFIDASDIYTEDRRVNTFSQIDLETISSLLKTNHDLSITVSIEDIKNNEYKLSPLQYLVEQDDKNAVKLGDIAHIRRGFMLSAKELDLMTSNEKTSLQYLKTSDINDGIINENLIYLSNDLDESFDKYLINDKNIIISRSGTPFKSAIYEEKENKVYAQGNLIIIEVNSHVINPYYLQAFLHSDLGQTVLKRNSTEGEFNLLSISNLKELMIPLKTLEKQDKIAHHYKKQIQMLKTIEKQKLDVQKTIKNIF